MAAQVVRALRAAYRMFNNRSVGRVTQELAGLSTNPPRSRLRLPPAFTGVWLMHRLGVEAHLGQSGEAVDLCKGETFVLVVPKSERSEDD